MDNPVTYETVVDLLPAYAVGALEPNEMLAVEHYLQNHRALLARVEQLDLAMTQLAHTAPPAPLPAQLKRNLMTQVRAEAEDATSSHLAAVPSPPAGSVASPPLAAPPPDRTPDGHRERALALSRTQQLRAVQPPLPAPARRQPFNFGWAAAAAIAVAALFIIWIDLGAQRQLIQLRSELVNRETTIDQLNQQIQVQESQLEQNRLQLAFFAAPTQIVTLRGIGAGAGAGGVFYQHNERGLVVLHGLTPLPADQSYQLWLIPADSAPISGGLLAVESTEINRQQIALPADALAYNAIGISIEPASGSPTPTGNVIILGSKA